MTITNRSLFLLYSKVKGQFQVNCDLLLKPYTTTLTSCLKSFVDYNNNTEHTTTVLSNDKTTWKRGRLVLHSGENPSATFANRGVVRHYSMQVSPSERVELAMAIWIEEEKCSSNALLPPDQDVLRYCQMGDYLTFYQAQDENQHVKTMHFSTQSLSYFNVSYRNGKGAG